MTFVPVHTSFGTNYEVEVVVGEQITIRTTTRDGEVVLKTFKVGDMVEYDSYNLSYIGEIVNITAKRVIVRPEYSTKTKRMDFGKFSWRNWNFDLAETRHQNSDTMMYI